MQMKPIYLLIVFLFLFSCKTETKKEPVAKTPTKESPAPAPKTKSPNDIWKPFWKMFQTAVQEGDVETLVKHIEFPLRGSEAFNDGKQISKASFHKHFSKMFDETTRIMIKETENMSKFLTKTPTVADQLNVPVNQTVRSFMVSYVENEGMENQTESSLTFQFVEVAPAVFKLYSLVPAG